MGAAGPRTLRAMHPDPQRYLDWLAAHGVAVRAPSDLPRLADHRGPLIVGAEPLRQLEVPGGTIEEVRDPASGLAADHATEVVAHGIHHPLVRVRGREAWDLGCGTGTLMVVAARAGAARVLGTDVDDAALELARQTLARAGVDAELVETTLMDAIAPDRRADLLIVNLPHKPVPEGFDLTGCQNGGPDGGTVHAALADQLADRLAPDGQMVFSLHSLPHPDLLRRYAEELDLTMLAWRRRYFHGDEYGALRDVFRERTAAGTSLVFEEDGEEYLLCGLWVGGRR